MCVQVQVLLSEEEASWLSSNSIEVLSWFMAGFSCVSEFNREAFFAVFGIFALDSEGGSCLDSHGRGRGSAFIYFQKNMVSRLAGHVFYFLGKFL